MRQIWNLFPVFFARNFGRGKMSVVVLPYKSIYYKEINFAIYY